MASNIDIRTQAGLAAFQSAVLAWADTAATVVKNMNGQGVVVCPQPNPSYIGDPTSLATLSPEINGIADAFCAKFTSQACAVG